MKNCENKSYECCNNKKFKYSRGNGGAAGSGVYFFGFIGAVIYFISTAPNFWVGVLGFLKAIVWPVFMVYEAFKFLIG